MPCAFERVRGLLLCLMVSAVLCVARATSAQAVPSRPLSAQIDVRHGPLFLALVADVREHFAIGNTPVARDFMTSLTLRVGIDVEL